MLVGLQGSGKTTHAAKLAVHLRKQGRNPLLVAGDVYRPAAVNQLQSARQADQHPGLRRRHQTRTRSTSPATASAFADERGYNPVIIDTAGRLQIDERMMQELVDVKSESSRPKFCWSPTR